MITFCTKRSAQKIQTLQVHEKSEGRSCCLNGEITDSTIIETSGDRLMGRDHVAHRIPTMGTKEKWIVQTDRNATQVYPQRTMPSFTVRSVM
jgi:hypothetical protein